MPGLSGPGILFKGGAMEVQLTEDWGTHVAGEIVSVSVKRANLLVKEKKAVLLSDEKQAEPEKEAATDPGEEAKEPPKEMASKEDIEKIKTLAAEKKVPMDQVLAFCGVEKEENLTKEMAELVTGELSKK